MKYVKAVLGLIAAVIVASWAIGSYQQLPVFSGYLSGVLVSAVAVFLIVWRYGYRKVDSIIPRERLLANQYWLIPSLLGLAFLGAFGAISGTFFLGLLVAPCVLIIICLSGLLIMANNTVSRDEAGG